MINVIAAIGKVDWEAQFINGLSHPMTGIQIQRRCVDAVDVLAVTKVLHCDAVIISDHTLRVDESFIAELLSQKIRVIALTGNKKQFEKYHKVECVVIDEGNPQAAISTLSALARVNKRQPTEALQNRGQLIYVGGFGGGTGKSRFALELSFELSKDFKTLLVDADTYGPSLNQLLGLSANSTGLLEVCRQAERQPDQDKLLDENILLLSQNFYFLPGLIKTSRWVDLRIAALNSFWDQTIIDFDFVVVDAGPVFEPEPALSFESGLPRRNLVTTSAFLKSSKVTLTSRTDESSVTRLIKGFVENQKLFIDKEVSVVTCGPTPNKLKDEVNSAIQVHAGISNVHVLPFEPELVHAAERQNILIGQQAPNCQLAKEISEATKSIIDFGKTGKAASRLQKLMPKKKETGAA